MMVFQMNRVRRDATELEAKLRAEADTKLIGEIRATPSAQSVKIKNPDCTLYLVDKTGLDGKEGEGEKKGVQIIAVQYRVGHEEYIRNSFYIPDAESGNLKYAIISPNGVQFNAKLSFGRGREYVYDAVPAALYSVGENGELELLPSERLEIYSPKSSIRALGKPDEIGRLEPKKGQLDVGKITKAGKGNMSK